MTAVDAKLIKELRDKTGVAMGKCKQALVDTGGDIEKAIEELRKAGMASAHKKESREVNEGKIEFLDTDTHVVLTEANAETDFVVKNDKFQAFHLNITTELVNAGEIAELDDFLKQTYSKNPDQTIDDYRKETVSVLGENIVISRVFSLKKRANASYGIYSHMGGKIVVVVEIEGASDENDLAREIAMHAAAEAPEYLRPEDVPANIVEKEKEIAMSQMKGKPENVIEKILQGKMKSYYEQVCLLNQKFVKDPSMTVTDLVQNRAKAASKQLKVTRFVRWQVGAA